MKEEKECRVQVPPNVNGVVDKEPQLSIERTEAGHFRVMAKGWLAVIAVIVVSLVIVLSR